MSLVSDMHSTPLRATKIASLSPANISNSNSNPFERGLSNCSCPISSVLLRQNFQPFEQAAYGRHLLTAISARSLYYTSRSCQPLFLFFFELFPTPPSPPTTAVYWLQTLGHRCSRVCIATLHRRSHLRLSRHSFGTCPFHRP